MSNNDTRALLERACANSINAILADDMDDLGGIACTRTEAAGYLVTIRTKESAEREANAIWSREKGANERADRHLAKVRELETLNAHLDATKQDTERKLSETVSKLADVVDELAHVRETGAAELARASGDLVGAAVEIERLRAERDAAIAARDEAVAAFERSGAKGLVAMAQRDAAERARDEVGVQLVAAQARIKLLEEGATLLRHIDEFKGEQKWGANGANHYHVPCDVIDIGVGCFLSALDAVPGDALAPVGPPLGGGIDVEGSLRMQIDGLKRDVDYARDRIEELEEILAEARGHVPDWGADDIFGRITAALEASGIDSDNVKGVE